MIQDSKALRRSNVIGSHAEFLYNWKTFRDILVTISGKQDKNKSENWRYAQQICRKNITQVNNWFLLWPGGGKLHLVPVNNEWKITHNTIYITSETSVKQESKLTDCATRAYLRCLLLWIWIWKAIKNLQLHIYLSL